VAIVVVLDGLVFAFAWEIVIGVLPLQLATTTAKAISVTAWLRRMYGW
jgi:hypothetical protein